jgi:hypothetical protein
MAEASVLADKSGLQETAALVDKSHKPMSMKSKGGKNRLVLPTAVQKEIFDLTNKRIKTVDHDVKDDVDHGDKFGDISLEDLRTHVA